MDFIDVIRKRHMTRSFKPTPVSEEKLRQILSIAIRAPSAGHLQPWEFVVVRNKDTMKKLARAALDQDFISEAPVVIVTCSNKQRSASIYGQRGSEFYSVIDAAYASLMILFAVTNLNLGACFVGAFDDEKVSRILNLPPHIRPIGIIPIGVPNEKGKVMRRIALDDLVHSEKW